MDKTLWQQFLRKDQCPPWTCPCCKKGTISLLPKSLIFRETVASERAQAEDEWDPDWVEHVFTAWAECQNAACKQAFAITGTGGLEPGYDEEGSTSWYEYFRPMHCHPMPDIIVFPKKCPDEVCSELRSAFSLFWAAPEACAGRIRVALERLMDSLGVQKKRKNAKGKFSELSLHARIEAFAKGDPANGGNLMALKWLGNAGSHDGDVSKNDLLDAFEIIEHALGEVIDKRSSKVATLAKRLTKKLAKKRRR